MKADIVRNLADAPIRIQQFRLRIFHLCEIQVDRGDGKGFVAPTFDTTPGYFDTQPFPATPVKWTYQAIYRVGDSRVGQWSKPVSVTVGG